MNPAEEIFRDVTAIVEGQMRELVDDVADDLRKSISVPVDRSKRPPTRSRPGEYPRMDTKKLRGSVRGTVRTEKNGNVVGEVATDTAYDEILARTRPFDKLTEAKWAPLAERWFEHALK